MQVRMHPARRMHCVWRMRRVRLVAALAAVVALTAGTAGTAEAAPDHATATASGPAQSGLAPSDDAFYTPPDPLPSGAPGDVIRSRPSKAGPPISISSTDHGSFSSQTSAPLVFNGWPPYLPEPLNC